MRSSRLFLHGLVSAAVLLGIILGVPAPAAAAEAVLEVSGVITLADGAPATGASIRIEQFVLSPETGLFEVRKAASTAADADGRYRVVVPRRQSTRVRVSHPGSAGALASVFLSPKPSRNVQYTRNFSLVPASTVSGRVIDEAGRVVPGVEVLAYPHDQAYATSDPDFPTAADSQITTSLPDGTFRFDALSAGRVEILAQPLHHVAASEWTTAPASGVTVRVGSNGAVIEGQVVGRETGVPLSGVTVYVCDAGPYEPGNHTIPSRQTVTDSRGTFRIDRLPAANYRVGVRARGLMLFDSSPVAELRAGETTHGVTLRLYPGHTIFGRVTKRGTERPVAGVTIGCSSESGGTSAVTDQEGRYRLEGVPFDSRHATAFLSTQREGYLYSRNGQYAERGPQVRLEAEQLLVHHDFSLDPAAWIAGKVHNGAGEPVAGAEVQLVSGSSYNPSTETADDGTWRLPMLPGARARVRASLRGYAPATSPVVTGVAGLTDNMVLTLLPGATMSGVVADAAGRPVSQAFVEAIQMTEVGYGANSDSIAASATAADGTFTLRDVPFGRISISASARGYFNHPKETRDIAAGTSVSGVRLILKTGQRLTGRVTDSEGKPMAGVDLYHPPWSPDHGGSVCATTDAEGHFILLGVHANPADIELRWNDGNVVHHDVPVGDEEVTLVWDNFAELILHVVDATTSRPLPRFEADVWNLGRGPLTGIDGELRTRVAKAEHRHHTVELSAPGCLKVRQMVSAAKADPTRYEATVALGPGGSLAGRVLDKESRQPVAGADVELFLPYGYEQSTERGRVLKTAADGSFRFSKVPGTTVTVEVRPPAPLTKEKARVNVEHGRESTCEVLLGRGCAIMGRVIREGSGAPVVGELVQLSTGGHAVSGPARSVVTTDASGRFEFPGQPDDFYVISLPQLGAAASGHFRNGGPEVCLTVGTASLTATVKAPLLRPVAVRLEPVFYTSPDPPPYQEFYVVRGDTGHVITLPAVRSGTWKITLEGMNTYPQPEWLTLAPGEKIRREFQLPE